MRMLISGATFLCLPLMAICQNAIQPGMIVPVQLDTGLKVEKAYSGETVRATVMQDVPQTSIRRRMRVFGHVVSATANKNGESRLEIRFDSIAEHGKRIPFAASLRAIASSLEVEEAQVPEEMSSRGLTPETWDTQQIGGEQVYRGGGAVTSGITPVGKPTPWGALAAPRAQRGERCRGAVAGVDTQQAFWLFSSDACGMYGFDGLEIEHAGRTDPVGTIVLSSKNGKLEIGSGSGLLLRTIMREQAIIVKSSIYFG